MSNAKAKLATAESAPEKSAADKPRAWWHWPFLYPAFAVAALSAIPTYIEVFYSHKYDVPFGQSSTAKQQNDLWEKNLSCTAAPIDGFLTDFNIEVDAIICRSGDVLVRVRTPAKQAFYRWVPVEGFPIKPASLLFSEAYAADTRQPQRNISSVVCQRRLDGSKVLRRVQERPDTNRPKGSPSGDRCFDEVINTYSGQLLQRNEVKCGPC